MSIEWDHTGKPIATVDSVEKSNSGIIVTSSLNRSVYNDIFERLKSNIDGAKDKWFRPYIIDDVHSATKEFINARYGAEKGHRDSMDAMAYYGMWRANEKSEKKSLKELLKEYGCDSTYNRLRPFDEWLDSEGAERDALLFKSALIRGRSCGKNYVSQFLTVKERIKNHEEEQAAKLNEGLKRMLINSHYGVCWPSELIDSCERIDKYRKEEESMEDYKLFSGVLHGYDLTFDANKDYFISFPVDVRCREITHVYDNGTARPVDNVYRIRFCFNTGHGVIRADFYGAPKTFRRFIDDVEKRHKIAIVDTGFNGRFWSAFYNRYNNFRKDKETKEMTTKSKILQNIVGSDIYVKLHDTTDAIYLGKGQDLNVDISYGENLAGNISFVAYDDPSMESEKLRLISRGFIKQVIFNKPATIVIWRDGTKTVVKMNGKDKKYDPEKGLAMCIAKKCLGNEGNYYKVFSRWLEEGK